MCNSHPLTLPACQGYCLAGICSCDRCWTGSSCTARNGESLGCGTRHTLSAPSPVDSSGGKATHRAEAARNATVADKAGSSRASHSGGPISAASALPASVRESLKLAVEVQTGEEPPRGAVAVVAAVTRGAVARGALLEDQLESPPAQVQPSSSPPLLLLPPPSSPLGSSPLGSSPLGRGDESPLARVLFLVVSVGGILLTFGCVMVFTLRKNMVYI